MPRYEDRINALAKYLKVDPETIKEGYRENLFETEDGEEYFVVDKDEAYELAREDIESLFDDIGLEAFTPSFQDWIFDNAIDEGFLEECIRESYYNYASDIALEDGDEEYGTRLEQECAEAGLISEEDFEDAQYVGDEDLVKLLSEHLFEQVDDYREWFVWNFGIDDFTRILRDNMAIDMDAVVDECVSEDGIAHFISSYDGREIDLDGGLFAYRVN